LITFHSTKVEQTGPDTIAFDGDFTIRGVTKQERLTFTVTGKGTGCGTINGTMAFDRKQYGMNSGIPLLAFQIAADVAAKSGLELDTQLRTLQEFPEAAISHEEDI
jgi:polyisoprenoid-binding protein YceI